MPKYLFVLGKNWRLAIAEIIELLQIYNIKFKVVDLSPKVCIVNVNRKLTLKELDKIQCRLGGTLKIGSILFESPNRLLSEMFGYERRKREEIEPENWIPKVWQKIKGKRIKFTISIYPIIDSNPEFNVIQAINYLSNKTKQRLYDLGASKARYYIYKIKNMETSNKNPTNPLWPNMIIKERLTTPPNAEIMIVETYKNTYISRTATVYDSIWQQARDRGRPYVFPEISTSPKLSRIIINLARARKNDTILDPFCGTGTILMEALLMEINVIGMDIDEKQVKYSRANLRWLIPHLKRQMKIKIIQGDATELKRHIHEKIDAICTEPDLGPVQKEQIQYNKAIEIKQKLEQLYYKVLREAIQILEPKKRIVLTTPRYNTNRGIIAVDIKNISQKLGFKIVKLLPNKYISEELKDYVEMNRTIIVDKKPNQYVERQIIVLEK